jgi:MFS transporter, DHA1 family, inner membrane transport protein
VLVAFAFLARTTVAAVVLLVLFGTLSFALGPVVQNAVIDAARVPGGSLVSAANQGAFNVANAVGAALGALVLSQGLGYTAPIWVGAVLALVGAGVAVLAGVGARRHDRRHDPVAVDVRTWRRACAELITVGSR